MSWVRRAALDERPSRRVLLHPVMALSLHESSAVRRRMWQDTGRVEVVRDGLPYLVRPVEALEGRGRDGDG